MKNYMENSFERLPQRTKSRNNSGYRRLKDTDLYQQVVGFTCMVCHQWVNADPLLSGVNNRNHCPYCFTSKHVDLWQAGDRLNACRSDMRAIGLAWKKSRNKYGSANGEIMIIHVCEGCNGLSINRVAADDDHQKLENLFRSTIWMEKSRKQFLRDSGIQLMEDEHQEEFEKCIFGVHLHPKKDHE